MNKDERRAQQLRGILADLNKLREHIDAQAAEIARLRAAEVPLSANVGFARVKFGEDWAVICGAGIDWDEPYATEDDLNEPSPHSGTPVALIPLTAWDRT